MPIVGFRFCTTLSAPVRTSLISGGSPGPGGSSGYIPGGGDTTPGGPGHPEFVTAPDPSIVGHGASAPGGVLGAGIVGAGLV